MSTIYKPKKNFNFYLESQNLYLSPENFFKMRILENPLLVGLNTIYVTKLLTKFHTIVASVVPVK